MAHFLANEREHLLLNFTVVDADATACDFVAIADHIVLGTTRRTGVGIQQWQVFFDGHGKHML